mmetsp:Transcript_11582/g.29652  ORF Transcript_11582/g.29652 Transcript_11582/m.29652 type:complete len:465 (-) Transcript_11582:635-2029(-)
MMQMTRPTEPSWRIWESRARSISSPPRFATPVRSMIRPTWRPMLMPRSAAILLSVSTKRPTLPSCALRSNLTTAKPPGASPPEMKPRSPLLCRRFQPPSREFGCTSTRGPPRGARYWSVGEVKSVPLATTSSLPKSTEKQAGVASLPDCMSPSMSLWIFSMSPKRAWGGAAVSLIISAWISGVTGAGCPDTIEQSSRGTRIFCGSFAGPTSTVGRSGRRSWYCGNFVLKYSKTEMLRRASLPSSLSISNMHSSLRTEPTPRSLYGRVTCSELTAHLIVLVRMKRSSFEQSERLSCSGERWASLAAKSMSRSPLSTTRAAPSSCIIGPLVVITMPCRFPLRIWKRPSRPTSLTEAHARSRRVSKKASPRALKPEPLLAKGVVEYFLKRMSSTASRLRSEPSELNVSNDSSGPCLSSISMARFVPAKAVPTRTPSAPPERCHPALFGASACGASSFADAYRIFEPS